MVRRMSEQILQKSILFQLKGWILRGGEGTTHGLSMSQL